MLLLLGLCGAAPSPAVPPPPPLPVARVELPLDGSERVVNNEVHAYRQIPLAFEASAGDELILWLKDTESLLVLDLEAPSGLRWIQGAKAGADGLRLRLPETGAYRLYVAMSGDAARTGRKSTFQIKLMLRRITPTKGP